MITLDNDETEMVGKCSVIYFRPQRPLLREPYTGNGYTHMKGWRVVQWEARREKHSQLCSSGTGESVMLTSQNVLTLDRLSTCRRLES